MGESQKQGGIEKTILNKEEIKKLIVEKDLIKEYIDLETQLQTNGFDLTVREVSNFNSRGSLDFSNKERILPELRSHISFETLHPRAEFWELLQGCYSVEFNEVISLPLDLMAISIHRSSLMRCGVTTATGCWDAGYQGRGRTLLIVSNPFGLKLYKNARLVQMTFHRLNPSDKGYQGSYQREGIKNDANSINKEVK